jgi:predicted nucleic acid-binding protein
MNPKTACRHQNKEISPFTCQNFGLARLRRSSVLVMPTRKVSASPDDSDNRFLECAEAARADFLVTGNTKHFPKRWKRTEVVNAREFLSRTGSSFLE